jgi:hypothetical protein
MASQMVATPTRGSTRVLRRHLLLTVAAGTYTSERIEVKLFLAALSFGCIYRGAVGFEALLPRPPWCWSAAASLNRNS